MTLFSITDTSDYLKELLSGETSGEVHSVYRKTINLSINGTLVALQAKGSPISPISLITTLTSEEMERLEISAGDFVTLKEDIITIYRSNRTLQASTLLIIKGKADFLLKKQRFTTYICYIH